MVMILEVKFSRLSIMHTNTIFKIGINLGPSKAQILAKIAEIASWSKCTEAGAMNGRTCWLVQSDVLDRYNLTELSAINTLEFATETKKRGRKADDSRTDEDTPPAKTLRVSLIKKFVQPTSLSANRVPPSQENELPESGKNLNEPVKQLPTLPSPSHSLDAKDSAQQESISDLKDSKSNFVERDTLHSAASRPAVAPTLDAVFVSQALLDRPAIGNRLVRLSTKDSVKVSERKMRIHKRAAHELNQSTDKDKAKLKKPKKEDTEKSPVKSASVKLPSDLDKQGNGSTRNIQPFPESSERRSALNSLLTDFETEAQQGKDRLALIDRNIEERQLERKALSHNIEELQLERKALSDEVQLKLLLQFELLRSALEQT